MAKYKYGRLVIINKGRLRGEEGKMVGETNLNMDHRILVYRYNPRARNKVMKKKKKELSEDKDNANM